MLRTTQLLVHRTACSAEADHYISKLGQNPFSLTCGAQLDSVCELRSRKCLVSNARVCWWSESAVRSARLRTYLRIGRLGKLSADDDRPLSFIFVAGILLLLVYKPALFAL